MGTRPRILIDKVPRFWVKGGVFHVDYEIDGLPVVALTPHVMLKAIVKARDEYESWSKTGAEVRTR